MKIITKAPTEAEIKSKLATSQERRAEFHKCECYDYVIEKLKKLVEEKRDIMSLPVDLEKPNETTQILLLAQKMIRELENIIEDL